MFAVKEFIHFICILKTPATPWYPATLVALAAEMAGACQDLVPAKEAAIEWKREEDAVLHKTSRKDIMQVTRNILQEKQTSRYIFRDWQFLFSSSQDDDVVTTSVLRHLHEETAHKVLTLKSSKQLAGS